MITSNIIHRTFRIKCGKSFGTGFTIDVETNQYLVSAKHVLARFAATAPLEVFGNGHWSQISAELVGHTDSEDVTVLALNKPLSPTGLPVEASSDGLSYGQDVYFLGFPYGVLTQVVFGSEGTPLPLVKRAILSGVAGSIYLLDGHNNPGFSGGPVVFSRKGNLPNAVASVISGYRYSPEPVYVHDTKTDLSYRYNTGIIITYRIESALHLIRGR